jgi:hypothetical protein
MLAPLDPETRSPAGREPGRGQSRKSEQQQRRYSVNVELQALLSIFAQIAIPFVLAVLMGGLR